MTNLTTVQLASGHRNQTVRKTGFESPITLAGDESCLHTGELEAAARRYDMINIELGKTGSQDCN
ncbi:MAG: hypothetical protein GY732_02690 [Gammaproteobacteria bacterium]|nr:hypothetical protein [Gammaproteobacteria bacterium]